MLENQAHAGTRMAHRHACLHIQLLIIFRQAQADPRVQREWVQCIDVAAVQTQIRRARGNPRVAFQVHKFGGADERIAAGVTPFGCGRFWAFGRRELVGHVSCGWPTRRLALKCRVNV